MALTHDDGVGANTVTARGGAGGTGGNGAAGTAAIQGGQAGSGGAGGAAFAAANDGLINAYGGNGGSAGAPGTGPSGTGMGATGGRGGAAFAEARSRTLSDEPLPWLEAVGGQGGSAYGVGGRGGDGGAATARGSAGSSTGDWVAVSANATGGDGGAGFGGARGGNGAGVSLDNVVSGTTTGMLTLSEAAHGGDAGYAQSDPTLSGQAGAASASLVVNDSVASSVEADVSAYAGWGGAGPAPAAGRATVSATSTRAGTPVYASASGYGGGSVNAGDGYASSAATSTSDATASASALAQYGGTRNGAATAVAMAKATDASGSASATATSNVTGQGAVAHSDASAVGSRGTTLAKSYANNEQPYGGYGWLATTATSDVAGATHSQTQATFGGAVAGLPDLRNGSNGLTAFSFADGAPAEATISATLASHPDVAAQVTPNSFVIGLGSLGANATGGSSHSYSASAEYRFALPSMTDVLVGLLDNSGYGDGFGSLTFAVSNFGSQLFSQTFASLATAKAFFDDDPLAFELNGEVDLLLTYTLTSDVAQGFDASYLVATGVRPVPEASGLAMTLLGLSGLWFAIRARRSPGQVKT